MQDANRTCGWRIYADFAKGLIRTFPVGNVDEPVSVELGETVSATSNILRFVS
jgi:hypothetical protein